MAEYHGRTGRNVPRWVAQGRLPAVHVLGFYLVRIADCEAVVRPGMGRPCGAKDKRKRKTRSPK